MKKLTNEDFIKKAKDVHGNKYNYSSTIYTKSTKKINIICNIHGVFEQEANSHLKGSGCSKCSGNNKSNTRDFITKAKKIHGDKYDYSIIKYVNAHKLVKIICAEHGVFIQKPNTHLSGVGCNKCGIEQQKRKTIIGVERFIDISEKIHINKYDYSLVEYINNKTKVKIVCPEHGIFEQIPDIHMKGSGCKKCGFKKIKQKLIKTQTDFINDAIKIHGDKYDYSIVDYDGSDKKIKIICRLHGVFKQKPYKHLHNQGCPICSESKLEKEIKFFLTKNNINFKQEYGKLGDSFYLNRQKLDFYLPKYNIAIECQGDQHFKPVDFGNKGYKYALDSFKKNIFRDFKKFMKCKKLDIPIIYYCSDKNLFENRSYFGDMYSDLNKIGKIISEMCL